MAASVNERVRKRREAQRAAGLRPVQLWVPDARRPGYAEEIRRQCLLLWDDPQEKEVAEWIEAVADTKDWK